MAFLHRSIQRRRALVAVPALAVALLVVALAGPGRAATTSSCRGTITAGHLSGIQLTGYALRAQEVSCGRAHTVINDYLHTKVVQSSEKCASQAENPGRGCLIDGYTCHTTGRIRLSHGRTIHDEACRQGGRRITFTESDHTRG